MPKPSRWRDSPEGFGAISRAFHWGMAALFALQLTSVLTRKIAEGSSGAEMLWSWHSTIGGLLWVLALARGAWGLANGARRPREGDEVLGLASEVGHFALYALMIITPSIAIVRALASERGLNLAGFQLAPLQTLTQSTWVEAIGQLHGPAAWTLFLLIAGHIVMALYHQFCRRDGTLDLMIRGHSQSERAP